MNVQLPLPLPGCVRKYWNVAAGIHKLVLENTQRERRYEHSA